MSRFINEPGNYTGYDNPSIDFKSAARLNGGGSTCDIYKTRWQRREVFIKRLKPEHRTNPLYLDALDKEFDIGIQLHHPSLPQYREFHRDYIIMDYVDGETLDEMLLRKDKWLRNKKNVTKILSQLVNVVEYLHFHNIVHSDIKPDNLIITSDSRNLILLDFDKSHTHSLGNTTGDPGLYGLSADHTGSTKVDFYGMAKVAEKLCRNIPNLKDRKFSKFIKECRSEEPDFERLKKILGQGFSLKHTLIICAALLIMAVIAVGLFYAYNQPPKATDTEPETDLLTIPLTENTDSAKSEYPAESKMEIKNNPVSNYIDQEKLLDEATQKAALLDQRIQPLFNELLESLDNLKQLKNDSSLTSNQLLEAIRKHSDKEDEYIKETFEIMNESFPGLSDREAWRILSQSKAYTGYKRRATPELRVFGLEIENRGGIR